MWLGATSSARSSPIEVFFDFNGLATNANNSAVNAYINGQLPGTAVTGASGGLNYDGEGYVVGFSNGNCIVPLTLGNTDSGVYHGQSGDNFLINLGSDRITMSLASPIYSASFDFEIFPNGTVANGNLVSPSQYPDFRFRAYDSSNNLLADFHVLSVMPATGLYPNSPQHPFTPEPAPQFLSQLVAFTFAAGATRLEFIDWPERIGIDNLRLGFSPQSNPDPPPPTDVAEVPEPSTLLITGLFAIGGFSAWLKRRTNH
jgi:hypothetical protein